MIFLAKKAVVKDNNRFFGESDADSVSDLLRRRYHGRPAGSQPHRVD
jgi:hypothetical protein